MKNIFLTSLCFFVFSLPTFAQKETNTWIFGRDVMMTFDTYPPRINRIITNLPPPSDIHTQSSMSDVNGNFLFSADIGINFWNKNFNRLHVNPGGGFHTSSLISFINKPHKYILFHYAPYSFTIDLKVMALEVDTRLNNGLGGVVSDVVVYDTQYKSFGGRGTGFIEVVQGADCDTHWLIVEVITEPFTRPSSPNLENIVRRELHVLKINENGQVSSTPTTKFIMNEMAAILSFKFSNDTKTLLLYDHYQSMLLTFDNSTGTFSNKLGVFPTRFLEFSPDNSKIYALNPTNSTAALEQYDISNYNFNAILSSKFTIAATTKVKTIHSRDNLMQRALDKRLYFIDSTEMLNVIHKPNERGASCQYETNIVNLQGRNVFELPKFNSYFFNIRRDFSFQNAANSCNTVEFKATSPNINDTYSWNFGDGTAANIQNPIKTYTQAGTYIVKLKIGACEFNKTVVVQKLATINLKPTLNLCHLETGNFGINSETGFVYQWKPATGLSNPNIANPIIRLDNQGDTLRKIAYKLIVTNSTTNCKDSASIAVSVSPALKPISAGKDTTICSNQIFKLGQTPPAGGGGATPPVGGWGAYQWTPTTGLDSANILKPLLKLENNSNKIQKLTYILRATQNNCSIFDTVIITLLPKIQAPIIGSNAVCPYSKNMVYKSPLNTGGSPPAPEGGVKIVKWEVFGGTIITPQVGGGGQTPPSGGGGLVLDSIAINWGTINDKAFVKVILQNELGCKDSTILNVKISPIITSPLTPKGGMVCYNESIEIGTKPLENYSYRWYEKNIEIDTLLLFSNTNIANPSIKNLTKNTKIVTHTYYVAVRNNATGCEFLDSVFVKVFPKIEFYAGKDSLICSNTSLKLGSPPAPEGGVLWLWTLNNSTIKISEILNSNSIANPTFSYINKTSKPLILRLALTTKHPNSECQKTDSIRITVLPAIKKHQIYGSSVICPNAKNITYKISQSHLTTGESPPTLEVGVKVLKWEVFGGTIITPPVGGGGQTPPSGAGGLGLDSISVNFDNSNDKAFIGAILQNDAGCYDTIKLGIRINQALKPSKPVGKTQICVNQGQNISYETNFTNGSSYEWFVLGGKIMKQTANKVVVNWAKKSSPLSPEGGIGLVWVKENSLTQTDKCAGNSDTLQVKILASPDSTLQIIGDTSPCEFSQNITYQFGTNLSYNPTSKYVWTIENGEIIGKNLNTITVNWKSSELKNGSKNMGKITVLETFENGCVGKLQSLEVSLTSLEQCLKIPTLLTDKDSTFPFWRIIGLENYPNSEVIVYSLTGAKIYESSNYLQNFDFSALASGVYVYVLQVRKGAEKVVFRGKMVVVR